MIEWGQRDRRRGVRRRQTTKYSSSDALHPSDRKLLLEYGFEIIETAVETDAPGFRTISGRQIERTGEIRTALPTWLNDDGGVDVDAKQPDHRISIRPASQEAEVSREGIVASQRELFDSQEAIFDQNSQAQDGQESQQVESKHAESAPNQRARKKISRKSSSQALVIPISQRLSSAKRAHLNVGYSINKILRSVRKLDIMFQKNDWYERFQITRSRLHKAIINLLRINERRSVELGENPEMRFYYVARRIIEMYTPLQDLEKVLRREVLTHFAPKTHQRHAIWLGREANMPNELIQIIFQYAGINMLGHACVKTVRDAYAVVFFFVKI